MFEIKLFNQYEFELEIEEFVLSVKYFLANAFIENCTT